MSKGLFMRSLEALQDHETDGGRLMLSSTELPQLDVDPEKEVIQMKGPMAEMITQALNVAYSKIDPVTGETALDKATMESLGIGQETQAMDYVALRDLVDAINPPEQQTSSVLTVYGVSEDTVTPTDVIDISKALSTAENPAESMFFVVDNTQPEILAGQGGDPEKMVFTDEEEAADLMTAAVEGLARSYGCRVFASVTELARTFNFKKKTA